MRKQEKNPSAIASRTTSGAALRVTAFLVASLALTGCQLFQQNTDKKTTDPLFGDQPVATANKGAVPPPAEPSTFTSNATAAVGDLQGGKGLGFGGPPGQQTPSQPNNWQQKPTSDWSSPQQKPTTQANPKPGEIQLGPISPGGKQPVPVYKSSTDATPAPNPTQVAKVTPKTPQTDLKVVQTGGVTANSSPKPTGPKQLAQMTMDELIVEMKKHGVQQQNLTTNDKGGWTLLFTRIPDPKRPENQTMSTVEGPSPTEVVRRAVDLLEKQK